MARRKKGGGGRRSKTKTSTIPAAKEKKARAKKAPKPVPDFGVNRSVVDSGEKNGSFQKSAAFTRGYDVYIHVALIVVVLVVVFVIYKKVMADMHGNTLIDEILGEETDKSLGVVGTVKQSATPERLQLAGKIVSAIIMVVVAVYVFYTYGPSVLSRGMGFASKATAAAKKASSTKKKKPAPKQTKKPAAPVIKKVVTAVVNSQAAMLDALKVDTKEELAKIEFIVDSNGAESLHIKGQSPIDLSGASIAFRNELRTFRPLIQRLTKEAKSNQPKITNQDFDALTESKRRLVNASQSGQADPFAHLRP